MIYNTKKQKGEDVGKETVFNINHMVRGLYDALNECCKEDGWPRVSFLFSKTLPSELKGDEEALMQLFYGTLYECIKQDCMTNLMVELDAPEDFLYKEKVAFRILNVPFQKKEMYDKLKERFARELESLDAEMVCNEREGNLEIYVPLSTAELGERRYYRLPSSLMLNKKILLVLEENHDAMALTKMFRYFPMDISLSMKRLNRQKYDLEDFDLVLVDGTISDEESMQKIEQMQGSSKTNIAYYGECDTFGDSEADDAFCLPKPATQEDVYTLLVDVFWKSKRNQ